MTPSPSARPMPSSNAARHPVGLLRPALVVMAAAALTACGVAPLDAQWTDTAQPPRSLRGTTVLVVCEADEAVIKQLCQDRVATELRQLGANTALVPTTIDPTTPRLAEEARRVNAGVVFNTRITADVQRYGGGGSGFSVGLGMGGGFGGRGFGGVGISAPIGGSRLSQGYVANASVSDVGSGRLMWTGRASTARSEDINWQVDSLSKAVVGGAQQAGFF